MVLFWVKKQAKIAQNQNLDLFDMITCFLDFYHKKKRQYVTWGLYLCNNTSIRNLANLIINCIMYNIAICKKCPLLLKLSDHYKKMKAIVEKVNRMYQKLRYICTIYDKAPF